MYYENRKPKNFSIFFIFIILILIFIAGILFTVIIIYTMVRLIEKNIFRIFGKDALYMRIEDSLSEIFMIYYLKKEE